MTAKADSKKSTPESQLRSLIDRFGAKEQKLIRSVRAAVRKRLPTANELAYDYTSHVVIGYSPTDKGIQSILATDARPEEMRLYFNSAVRLADPKRLLMGTGKQARYIRVEKASEIAGPDIEALIVAAIDQSRVPLPSKGKGTLIMMSGGAKKRPARKKK